MVVRSLAGTLFVGVALAWGAAARATHFPPSVSSQSWACHGPCEQFGEYVLSGIEFPGPATSSIDLRPSLASSVAASGALSGGQLSGTAEATLSADFEPAYVTTLDGAPIPGVANPRRASTT